MNAASKPIQRPDAARLLGVDAAGRIEHLPRSSFVSLLGRGDLLVANDAATIPASLPAMHVRTGRSIEVRLAQRRSLDANDVLDFTAVVFGEGDWRTRTEDRASPPSLIVGDRLAIGPVYAIVTKICGHPRLVSIRFDARPQQVWAAIAGVGKPIQYAYLEAPLALWDVWTPIAGPPVAFEAPSAGFALDWRMLGELRRRGIGFATITHAAGISSTGDAALDAMLPLDEPYRIPGPTARAISRTHARGGRVIAIGTTVVRALESAARADGSVRAGDGVATLRIGKGTRLRVVDAILSGTHEPGTSHYELLRAFAPDATLARVDRELESAHYLTHEFGDSVFVEARRRGVSRSDQVRSALRLNSYARGESTGWVITGDRS